MKRKICIILLLIVIFVVSSYFYINAVFLPVHLKKTLTQKAEDYLTRTVTFKNIKYSFSKGVIIDDLTVYEKGDEKQPFFHAEEISFSIIIPKH